MTIERREDDYFLKQDLEQRRRLREAADAKAAELHAKGALAGALGVDQQAVVDRAHALGFDEETSKVLHLMPLVEVAWADGKVTANERLSILQAGEAHGAAPGSGASTYLASLLEARPSEAFFAEVRDILTAILQAKDAHPHSILELCRDVAGACGGFFGFGDKISDDERQLIEQIAASLDGVDDEVKAIAK